MGRYCKAYLLSDFRRFSGWTAATENARPTDEGGPRILRDDDVLYLQEDLVVTDDVFRDEHIIFDQVSPEWERFCREELGFDLPPHLTEADTP